MPSPSPLKLLTAISKEQDTIVNMLKKHHPLKLQKIIENVESRQIKLEYDLSIIKEMLISMNTIVSSNDYPPKYKSTCIMKGSQMDGVGDSAKGNLVWNQFENNQDVTSIVDIQPNVQINFKDSDGVYSRYTAIIEAHDLVNLTDDIGYKKIQSVKIPKKCFPDDNEFYYVDFYVKFQTSNGQYWCKIKSNGSFNQSGDSGNVLI
jgi:hypothetical protein